MAPRSIIHCALPALITMAACGEEDECPLPIEDFCGEHCDDMQYWIDSCEFEWEYGGAGSTGTSSKWEGCWTWQCGEYQVLEGRNEYSGATWYFDADGTLVGYSSSWEGDGGGVCGDSEYSGSDRYGVIPEEC